MKSRALSADVVRSSGAATTASRLGQPDLAFATLNDFVDTARMICSLNPEVPVIADADTGYAFFAYHNNCR